MKKIVIIISIIIITFVLVACEKEETLPADSSITELADHYFQLRYNRKWAKVKTPNGKRLEVEKTPDSPFNSLEDMLRINCGEELGIGGYVIYRYKLDEYGDNLDYFGYSYDKSADSAYQIKLHPAGADDNYMLLVADAIDETGEIRLITHGNEHGFIRYEHGRYTCDFDISEYTHGRIKDVEDAVNLVQHCRKQFANYLREINS